MLSTGNIEYEPVRVAGRWAGYHAGYLAALATVVGLHAARLRGAGEHLDVAMFEAMVHNVDMRLTQMQAYQYSGRIATRQGSPRWSAAGSSPAPTATCCLRVVCRASSRRSPP